MLLVTKKDITEENLNSILNRLEQLGIQHFSYTQNDSVFIHCRDEYIPKETLEKLPGVDSVLESHRKFRLVSREHKPEDTVLTVGDVHIGGEMPVIIAGPCAVESEEQILEIASFLKSQGVRLLRGGAFKPRTSPYSFAGLGKKGLRLLRNVKEKTGLMVVTEVLDHPNRFAKYAEFCTATSRGENRQTGFAEERDVCPAGRAPDER
jgi:3-deoxy-7-phosphoheptulonate synthase